MRFTYLATFLSGTATIVEKSFKTLIPDVEIQTVLDGGIIFNTAENFQNLTSLGFVNNVFVVIKEYSLSVKATFPSMVKWCETHDLNYLNAFTKKLGFTNFRIRFISTNTFVSYNDTAISNIARKLSKELNITVNRLNPDTELWFMQRGEGYSYVLLRLTNNLQVEHRLKGQLRHELANLMCLLSEPNDSDIFLDPFAGYGTIIEERQKFRAKQILGFEKDLSINGLVPVEKADFFNSTIKDSSITKIVTDPPWGLFDKSLDINEFYNLMFRKFDRILAEKSILVLLVNRDTDIQPFLKSLPFAVSESYDILVSGKKATIYKIVRG